MKFFNKIRFKLRVFSHPFFIGIISLLFITACTKKDTDLQWSELTSPTELNLNSIYFTDTNKGHIVGGSTWFEGVYLHTEDGGNTWLKDSLRDKEVLAITFDQNNNGYAVGIDGHIFFKDDPEDDWEFWRQNRWFVMRDAAFYNRQNGVIVGGESFQFGKILKMEDDYILNLVDTVDTEIAAVTYSDENTVHLSGYGVVMRSTDAGFNFTRLDIDGDFYKDIHFPSSSTGYIVGSSGTILKSTDNGASYEKLRDGNKILISNKGFEAVFFVDESKGYIVGTKGLFWKTTNGGNDWKIIPDFPEVDLHDIFVINNIGYIVGENGRIFSFSD